MIIYRIALTSYCDTSGEGARIYGGRWNRIGEPAIYGSNSISSSLLERLTIDPELFSSDRYMFYSTMVFECPDELILSIGINQLPENWDSIPPKITTTNFGSKLFKEGYLGFEVPSVVDHSSKNYVLNPLHPKFSLLTIKTSQLKLDYRIIRY